MPSTFCLDCGAVTPAGNPRCANCRRATDRRRVRNHNTNSKAAPKDRGYDEAWRRLSARARRLQPFCADCGATTDLQADHTPEAWRRKDRGLPIRLQDVAVVCGPCNRRRGAARGEHVSRGRRRVEPP